MKLPQLSLRELFLLVGLVAMGCGWWANRSQLLVESHRIQEASAKQREQIEIDEYLIRVMRIELKNFGRSVERDEDGMIHVKSGNEGYGRWLQKHR